MRRRDILGSAAGLTAASSAKAAPPSGRGGPLSPAGVKSRHMIIQDFPRPSADLLASLKAGPIYFTGSPFGFQDEYLADVAIKPVRDDMRIFGTAFTVHLPEPDLLLVSHAINMAKAGDVLVIDVGGQSQLSVFGYSMSQSCLNRGIAGAIVDGAVLDVGWLRGETPYAAEEEKRRGGLLPVYTRAQSPTWAAWNKPGSINVPVKFGGLTVEPGDLVYGAREGVFIIPQRRLPELFEVAKRYKAFASGRNWLPRVKAGETWFDILEMKANLLALAIPEFASPDKII